MEAGRNFKVEEPPPANCDLPPVKSNKKYHVFFLLNIYIYIPKATFACNRNDKPRCIQPGSAPRCDQEVSEPVPKSHLHTLALLVPIPVPTNPNCYRAEHT
jgi:hypothetical protein